jgi:hypothetical protein
LTSLVTFRALCTQKAGFLSLKVSTLGRNSDEHALKKEQKNVTRLGNFQFFVFEKGKKGKVAPVLN